MPGHVLHLLTGGGDVGAATGQGQAHQGHRVHRLQRTAWAIQRGARRTGGAIVPFIAETGGINAMIADSSSALPEQVMRDAVRSAFDSAGQRCSATRVLFVQDDVAKQDDRHAGRRHRGAGYRRSHELRDRHRAGDRPGGAG